ncbi:MAG: hypothetical protein QXH47_07905 [Candidatus Bathyarchaeia archaeon]
MYDLIGYMTFRRYLKDGLGERLKRIEGLLTELGCNYPLTETSTIFSG